MSFMLDTHEPRKSISPSRSFSRSHSQAFHTIDQLHMRTQSLMDFTTKRPGMSFFHSLIAWAVDKNTWPFALSTMLRSSGDFPLPQFSRVIMDLWYSYNDDFSIISQSRAVVFSAQQSLSSLKRECMNHSLPFRIVFRCCQMSLGTKAELSRCIDWSNWNAVNHQHSEAKKGTGGFTFRWPFTLVGECCAALIELSKSLSEETQWKGKKHDKRIGWMQITSQSRALQLASGFILIVLGMNVTIAASRQAQNGFRQGILLSSRQNFALLQAKIKITKNSFLCMRSSATDDEQQLRLVVQMFRLERLEWKTVNGMEASIWLLRVFLSSAVDVFIFVQANEKQTADSLLSSIPIWATRKLSKLASSPSLTPVDRPRRKANERRAKESDTAP